MDFADACAVVLARNYERAFVLTTDFRDFSAYCVPFASPEGAFLRLKSSRRERPEAERVFGLTMKWRLPSTRSTS